MNIINDIMKYRYLPLIPSFISVVLRIFTPIQDHANSCFFQNNFMRKSCVTKNYLAEVPKYRFAFPLRKND